MPPTQLLLAVQCSDEWDDGAPNYAIVKIEPLTANAIRSCMDRCEAENLSELRTFNYTPTYIDPPTDDAAYNAYAAFFEVLERLDNSGTSWAELPRGFALPVAWEHQYRTDLNEQVIDRSAVHWVCCLRNGETRLETQYVDRATIMNIAMGTSLQEAVPA